MKNRTVIKCRTTFLANSRHKTSCSEVKQNLQRLKKKTTTKKQKKQKQKKNNKTYKRTKK